MKRPISALSLLFCISSSHVVYADNPCGYQCTKHLIEQIMAKQGTVVDKVARNAASAAQAAANTAQTNAATAQATANTAVTDAATAQGTANTAVTNAATNATAITANAANIAAISNPTDPSPTHPIGEDLTGTEGGIVGCTVVSGGIRNLIVSTINDSGGVNWSLLANQNTQTGAGGTVPPFANSFTDGFTNSQAIITQNTPPGGAGYAAGVCQNKATGGHTDWYLPSLGELICLFHNTAKIEESPANVDNLRSVIYYSSTEYYDDPANREYLLKFDDGVISNAAKNALRNVRCVRRFTP